MRKAQDLLSINVKRLRSRLGYNQADLAHESGLSSQMIQKIEQGKTAPSPETIDKLVYGLKASHAELFHDDSVSIANGRMASELTVGEMEALVTRAAKRDGTINLEIERLKAKNKELMEVLPPEFHEAVPKLRPSQAGLSWYFLTGNRQYLKTAREEAQSKILALIHHYGLGPQISKSLRK